MYNDQTNEGFNSYAMARFQLSMRAADKYRVNDGLFGEVAE